MRVCAVKFLRRAPIPEWAMWHIVNRLIGQGGRSPHASFGLCAFTSLECVLCTDLVEVS